MPNSDSPNSDSTPKATRRAAQPVDQDPPRANDEPNAQRKEEADSTVVKYTTWAAGTGAIPIPLVDISAVISVQIMMLKDLCKLYDVPFSETEARSIVNVFIGSLSPAMLLGAATATLMKFLPGIGHLAATITQPVLASSFSYAVGKLVISHLENGGTLNDFDASEKKAKFRQFFEEGKQKIKNTVDKATNSASGTKGDEPQ